MKLKYQLWNEEPALVLREATTEDYMKTNREIWNFIHSHRHHVLRDYYKECKTANVRAFDLTDEEIKNGNFLIVAFKSTSEEHLPYIAILQEKLGLVVEGIPA